MVAPYTRYAYIYTVHLYTVCGCLFVLAPFVPSSVMFIIPNLPYYTIQHYNALLSMLRYHTIAYKIINAGPSSQRGLGDGNVDAVRGSAEGWDITG